MTENTTRPRSGLRSLRRTVLAVPRLAGHPGMQDPGSGIPLPRLLDGESARAKVARLEPAASQPPHILRGKP